MARSGGEAPRSHPGGERVRLSLGPGEARMAAALFERLFPADEHGPGASGIGVLDYVDLALAGPYREAAALYRRGLGALDRASRERHGASFADASDEEKDGLLLSLERDEVPGLPDGRAFFDLLRAHLQEGLFSDPVHGGNRDKLGWRFLGHPGVWFENSADESLSEAPATKGGEVRSIADLRAPVGDAAGEGWSAGYEPVAGEPGGEADVVLVGVGAVGSVVAPILARAGLRVVGLEAGPWRRTGSYVPDELTSTFYCRGEMGRKFLAETPRWRRSAGEPTREASFSLGRMMNGVGGSVVHWGGALRRFHPHHFRYHTHVRESFGEGALPRGHTLADWPVTYGDLEPYYEAVERAVGVAGDAGANPYLPLRGPYPMPPLRGSPTSEAFRAAAEGMGLHPYPTPVAVNSVPYGGRPATAYGGWMAGFGPFRDDRWTPGETVVPEALATGNFELRTGCRVLRVLTDGAGGARGVEYVDAEGVVREQRARAVVLCSYTFENVRLLLLSGDGRHPDGLGNNAGQVGRHYMTKMWADVYGHFPDRVFNRHAGPAAQMWGLDDYISEGFDSAAHGFVGGATPNVENQQLPIQISREPPPPGVLGWGRPYRDHLRGWQHVCPIRLQPDSLSYREDYLDLDPVYRDRSGLGLPLVRITCDMRENERRIAGFMEGKAEEILREMGAERVWRGPRFRGVCSSHDLGGARMGEDPALSVVGRDLEVHDTPGLYVYGGAVFPTCPGVNPTLTMLALCSRAAEGLVGRLAR